MAPTMAGSYNQPQGLCVAAFAHCQRPAVSQKQVRQDTVMQFADALLASCSTPWQAPLTWFSSCLTGTCSKWLGVSVLYVLLRRADAFSHGGSMTSKSAPPLLCTAAQRSAAPTGANNQAAKLQPILQASTGATAPASYKLKCGHAKGRPACALVDALLWLLGV